MGKKMLILSIVKNLRTRLRLILFTAIFSIALVWVLFSFVLTPDYQATSQILVEDTGTEASLTIPEATSFGPSIVETYRVIIRSPEVLKRVIIEENLETTIAELHDQINVTMAANSKVLNITVASTDKREAVQIADSVADVFIEEIPGLMPVNELSLIARASELTPASPVEENMVFSLGVAGAFGFIVGALLAFILELLNTVFKTGSKKRKETKERLQTVFK